MSEPHCPRSMTQYQTISASFEQGVCRVRIERPEAGNAINGQLVADLGAVLALCEGEQVTPAVTVLVLEGSPTVFCSGGDFDAMAAAGEVADAEPLYQLWLRMAKLDCGVWYTGSRWIIASDRPRFRQLA